MVNKGNTLSTSQWEKSVLFFTWNICYSLLSTARVHTFSSSFVLSGFSFTALLSHTLASSLFFCLNNVVPSIRWFLLKKFGSTEIQFSKFKNWLLISTRQYSNIPHQEYTMMVRLMTVNIIYTLCEIHKNS